MLQSIKTGDTHRVTTSEEQHTKWRHV